MLYFKKPEEFKSKFEIVSCFLECDGRFLLLHRQDSKPQGNTWGVPAGKVEKGEIAGDAIVRELEEETGYKVSQYKPKLFRTVFVRFPEYDFIYHMYYLTLASKPDITIDHKQHKGFEWVTPNEPLKKNLILDLDECIKLYYKI